MAASVENNTSEAEKFCLKSVYDGYFYKFSYNPVVPKDHINYILLELNINAHESYLTYDLLHKFLSICKTWFATTKNPTYEDFVKHVQKKMQELALNYFKEVTTTHQRLKYSSEKIVTVDFEPAKKNKNKNGRFIVTVDCKMSQVGSLRLDYSNLPDVKTKIERVTTWNHPPLSVKSLINWPYIGFILHLHHVSVAHYTTHSYSRFIRLNGCEEDLTINKETGMDLTQNFDNRIGLQCQVETLLMYLCLTKQTVEKFDEIPKRRKEEFVTIVETIIKALYYVRSKSCSVNLECTYASSKYKFIREFDITDDMEIPQHLKKKCKPGSKSDTRGKLIEVMTPNFKFNVSRCLFKYQKPEQERKTIVEYFDDILKNKDVKKVEAFLKKMKGDFSYLCGYCNAIYSDNTFYSMEKHIHDMHGSESPWTCMGCNVRFDAYQLAMHSWRHVCK